MSSRLELALANNPGAVGAEIARLCAAQSVAELHAALEAATSWGLNGPKPTDRQHEIEQRFTELYEAAKEDGSPAGRVIFAALQVIERRATRSALGRSGLRMEADGSIRDTPVVRTRRTQARSRERGGCQSSRTRGSRRVSSRSAGGGDSDESGGGEPPPQASSRRPRWRPDPRQASVGRFTFCPPAGAVVALEVA